MMEENLIAPFEMLARVGICGLPDSDIHQHYLLGGLAGNSPTCAGRALEPKGMLGTTAVIGQIGSEERPARTLSYRD